MTSNSSQHNKKRLLPGSLDKGNSRIRALLQNPGKAGQVTSLIVLTRFSFLLFICLLGLVVVTMSVAADNFISKNDSAYGGIVGESLKRDNKRGSIYDSNGIVLAQTIQNEGQEEQRVYAYPESMAHLLGTQPGQNFGSNGVEAYYDTALIGVDNVNIRNMQGNDLHLTVDAQLQADIYACLSDIDTGGVVVSECATGRVLAEISLPTYDITVSKEEADAMYFNGEYVNNCMASLTPGSVFKLLSACVLVDQNCMPYIEYDGGVCSFEDTPQPIRNYDGNAYSNVDIYRAIEVSSNVWFSTAAWELCNRGGTFSAGTFIAGLQTLGMEDSIQTQLGRLYQDHSLTNADKWELLQSSFGQGALGISPLYLNIVVSAIATDGVMYRPYFVEKIVNPKGKTVSETLPEVLPYSVSENARAAVRQGMTQAAEAYGLTYNGLTGQVLAKTGTAEVTQSRNNKWVTCAVPADNPVYTFTLIDIEGGEMSKTLYSTAQSIINLLAVRENNRAQTELETEN